MYVSAKHGYVATCCCCCCDDAVFMPWLGRGTHNTCLSLFWLIIPGYGHHKRDERSQRSSTNIWFRNTLEMSQFVLLSPQNIFIHWSDLQVKLLSLTHSCKIKARCSPASSSRHFWVTRTSKKPPQNDLKNGFLSKAASPPKWTYCNRRELDNSPIHVWDRGSGSTLCLCTSLADMV